MRRGVRVSSTRLLAHAISGTIMAASLLLGSRRRAKFLGHLHQLLLPVIVSEVNGDLFKLTVSGRSAAYWTLSGIRSEPETLRWINTLRSGEVFYDIGSNIGLYSLCAAARGCVCVAFEPNPFSFDTLVRNMIINGYENSIVPLRFALSDSVSITRVGIANTDAGSVGCSLAEAGDKRMTVGTLVSTLDRKVTFGNMPFPNHLKIDVDGKEEAVLRGGKGVLGDGRLRSLLLEVAMLDDVCKQSVRLQLASHGIDLVPSESSTTNWLFRRR